MTRPAPLSALVAEFNRKFEQPVAEAPTLLATRELDDYAARLVSELGELLTALRLRTAERAALAAEFVSNERDLVSRRAGLAAAREGGALFAGREAEIRELEEVERQLREEFRALDLADLADIAREAGDLIYTAAGLFVALGIPLEAVLYDLHRSNLTRTLDRASGRIVKAEGYRQPRTREVVRLAGVGADTGEELADLVGAAVGKKLGEALAVEPGELEPLTAAEVAALSEEELAGVSFKFPGSAPSFELRPHASLRGRYCAACGRLVPPGSACAWCAQKGASDV